MPQAGLLDSRQGRVRAHTRARSEAQPASEATAILNRLRSDVEDRSYTRAVKYYGKWTADWRSPLARPSGFQPANQANQIRHRPDPQTRLKNGSEEENTPGDGERNITLAAEAIEAISLYIDTERPAVADGHGREPLFPTPYGRAGRSTIRRKMYRATSCRWAPTGSDDQYCDGSCDPDSDVCPYSYYPHAIRRGAIVRHLSGGLHPSIASERFDVSVRTLRKHYDPGTKRKRKEDRTEAVKSSW